MKLRLLIDTSVWLKLAADHRQLPILDALTYIWEANELELIFPATVLEEFDRNRERVMAESKRSLSGHFRQVRDAILKFAPQAERESVLRQLNEVDHKIAVGGEAVNDAIDQIGKLFDSASLIEPTEIIKARAADRALAKLAPCHRQRNSIADAVIFETYAEALAARTDPEDIFAFVTHNEHDFSAPGGDTRVPHSDLAALFDGAGSRYVTVLSALLSEYAPELVEEVKFEREWSQEPRKLSELVEAEEKLFTQVWYGRKWGLIDAVDKGREKIVPRAIYDAATPDERRRMVVKEIWDGMVAAMKDAEGRFPEELGPWTDFEWGMLSGKLSAIRWVLGDDWDMLDT